LITAAVIVGFSVAPPRVVGQTLTDILNEFKWTASQGKRYCDSIPYSSLRSECVSQQQDVGSYCDETTCTGLSYRDRRNVANRLKEEIAELESRLSNAKDDEKRRLENERDTKRRDLELREREIQDTVIQLKGRLEKSQRCRHARLEVQKRFLQAGQEATADGGREAAIKKIASEYHFPHWNEEGNKHSQAIIDIQNNIDRCTQRLDGRE
jgi:hypothetical protein